MTEGKRTKQFYEQRASDEIALRGLLICGAFLERPPQLLVQPDGNDLGWPSAKGRPPSLSELLWLVSAFRFGCKRAGLRIIGSHVLRHTFCSHLAMRGAAPKAIQELAGHSTLSMTLRYMHLAPSALCDVSWVTPGICANCRSSGAATEEAMVSALAPWNVAVT